MHAAQFALPVRVVLNLGAPVTEIYSAADALDLLIGLPTQEGSIFQRAVDRCLAACSDATEAEEARNAFVTFANASGIMAPDVTLDSLYEDGELKPIYR